jgi:hypothetical protein
MALDAHPFGYVALCEASAPRNSERVREELMELRIGAELCRQAGEGAALRLLCDRLHWLLVVADFREGAHHAVTGNLSTLAFQVSECLKVVTIYPKFDPRTVG